MSYELKSGVLGNCNTSIQFINMSILHSSPFVFLNAYEYPELFLKIAFENISPPHLSRWVE